MISPYLRAYLRTLAGPVLMPALVLVATSSPVSAQFLANTPWPMFQHDPQHTGRTPHLGPLYVPGAPGPDAVAFVDLGNKIKAQPSIGEDGTIYMGVGWKFCAVTPSPPMASPPVLAMDWCTDLPSDISPSTAAIDVNGFVYFGDRNNSLSAFRPDGTLACRYTNGHEGDINTGPGIGPDGTIYFAQGQSNYGQGPIVAVAPAPNCGLSGEKWHTKVDTTIGTSSPAIATVGVDTFVYIGDNSGFVHKLQDCAAFSPGSPCASAGGAPVAEVWRERIGAKVRASPVIGPDGTVYIGSDTGFKALDPATGATLSTFDTGGFVYSTAALAPDGTLYVGSQDTGNRKSLFALYRDWTDVAEPGKLKERWTFEVVSEGDRSPFPIIGGDGVVYVAIGRWIYALSPFAGELFWSYKLDNIALSHPSIGGTATTSSSGTAILYVTTASGRLYGFYGQRTASDLNQPPVADAGGNKSATVGQVVTFNGSASSDHPDDPAGNNLSYSWNLGDGITASGRVVTHTYWTPGARSVTLTVSDGFLSDSDTITASVSGTGGLPIDDSFTRAGCTQAQPCTTLGNNWAEVQGDLVIIDNELRNSLTKANHIAIRPDLAGANLSASASFASVNNGPGPRFGLILRYQGPGNYYVLYRQAGATNALRIAKVVSGVETLLASAPGGAVPLNTFFVLTADATTSGGTTTLTLSVQGGSSVSVQDSTFGGGAVGIMLGTGSNGLNQYRADGFHAQLN